MSRREQKQHLKFKLRVDLVLHVNIVDGKAAAVEVNIVDGEPRAVLGGDANSSDGHGEPRAVLGGDANSSDGHGEPRAVLGGDANSSDGHGEPRAVLGGDANSSDGHILPLLVGPLCFLLLAGLNGGRWILRVLCSNVSLDRPFLKEKVVNCSEIQQQLNAEPTDKKLHLPLAKQLLTTFYRSEYAQFFTACLAGAVHEAGPLSEAPLPVLQSCHACPGISAVFVTVQNGRP
ncbi:hypothetical protein niasHT_023377 [Heterodera trifolii]|uniref:Uncharacterized protein n=1 Tax=Heterodera trifolii TaxID=157864 RepID=A0ABD2K3W4_9BILA